MADILVERFGVECFLDPGSGILIVLDVHKSSSQWLEFFVIRFSKVALHKDPVGKIQSEGEELVVYHDEVLLFPVVNHPKVLHADSPIRHAVLAEETLFNHSLARVENRDYFFCVVLSARSEDNYLKFLVQFLEESVCEGSDEDSDLLLDFRVRFSHV